jgi:hypothetical protein
MVGIDQRIIDRMIDSEKAYGRGGAFRGVYRVLCVSFLCQHRQLEVVDSGALLLASP